MWQTADWQALGAHAARCTGKSIAGIIADEPGRAGAFAMRVGPLYLNFARQHYDTAAIHDLLERLERSGIAAQAKAMFDGERINRSEDRPVMHTALRSGLSAAPAAQDAHRQAMDGLALMQRVLERFRQQGISDVISVGIGGSDLGPRLALEALAGYADDGFRVHFLSSADGMHLQRYTRTLDPGRTAVLLVSKSFNTQETLINGQVLKDWIGVPSRIYAITARPASAEAFGIAPDNVLPIWDWVGGRFSVWSAVAFSTVLGIGMDNFRAFLRGAADMDAHFLETPVRDNIVAWQALTSIWNRNAMGYGDQAIIPYDERLEKLPDHLQQVLMESLGKSVRMDGSDCPQATSPVLMGASGNPSQHSFFQYLQQGVGTVPIDFIGVVKAAHCHDRNHHFILANLLAQSQSLANGQGSDDPHKRYPGNRPSTTILLDELTPYTLGMLLALYEHSVFVQAQVWGINAFDQWGVELGKQIATGLMPYVEGRRSPDDRLDPVTRELLSEMLRD